MNSQWHLYISFAKSIIRILSCVASLFTRDFGCLAAGFAMAEILGILEEVRDER